MRVKICGLTTFQDVQFCLDQGVTDLGCIFHPSSPRRIDPELAAGFPRGQARRVGVFVRHTPQQILDCMHTAGLDMAQLHGDQDQAACRQVGPERVIKVLWPQRYPDPGSMQTELDRFAPFCAAFLVDSGLQGGGHGRTLDVSWLHALSFPRPWYLAGGLGPETLPSLMTACRPDGVDLNSGVEKSPGHKDHARIRDCLDLIQELIR